MDPDDDNFAVERSRFDHKTVLCIGMLISNLFYKTNICVH